MEEMMTIKEAVAALKIGTTKFYSLVKEGEITLIRPAIYKNNRGPVRVRRAQILELKRKYAIE